MKIVTTGIQGCGKGTQARLLVENHGYILVEMGAEFRKIVASGSDLGNSLKEIMDAGKQIPADLGEAVMEEAINKYIGEERIIFDGLVRNDRNKEIFDRVLPDYRVVFFDLSVEKAKARLLGRMYDKETGETFPSGSIINEKNGNTLVKRDDDKDEAAILKRIQEFEEKTLPIVDIQRIEGRVIDVNADQGIDEVYKELVEKLGIL